MVSLFSGIYPINNTPLLGLQMAVRSDAGGYDECGLHDILHDRFFFGWFSV